MKPPIFTGIPTHAEMLAILAEIEANRVKELNAALKHIVIDRGSRPERRSGRLLNTSVTYCGAPSTRFDVNTMNASQYPNVCAACLSRAPRR